MPYTAFISYKSEDRDWALKLRDSLVASGIPGKDLFFDKDRLEAGYEWPEQLTQALAESKHAVFLISANAYKPQSYVTFEHAEFLHQHYRPAQLNPLLPQRRMIYVLLDENPPAGVVVHAVSAIKDDKRDPYAKGAAALAENDPTWKRVVKQVADAITADELARPVGCFVFAARRADFEALDFAKATPLGTLDAALERAGLDRQQFLDRYGDSPQSWKPFGTETIEVTLDRLKNRVNEKLNMARVPELRGLRVRLELPGDSLWIEDAAQVDQERVDRRDQEIRRWDTQPLMIVIDPLSLYIPRVVTLLNVVTTQLLSGGLATVMVLGPRKAPDLNMFLRRVLQSVAGELHRVFEPDFPIAHPEPLAGVNIDDEKEMQRMMIRTVATLFRGDKPGGQQPQAEFTRMARRT
jgi:hypothetical protein